MCRSSLEQYMCVRCTLTPRSLSRFDPIYILQLSTRIVGRGWQSPAIERDTVFFFYGFLSVSRSTRCREYSYLVTRFSVVAYAYFECPLTPGSSFFLLSHLRLTRSILSCTYTKRYDRDLWQQNVQWSTTKNMPLYTIDCILFVMHNIWY